MMNSGQEAKIVGNHWPRIKLAKCSSYTERRAVPLQHVSLSSNTRRVLVELFQARLSLSEGRSLRWNL